MDLSVIVCTYRREEVLCRTIGALVQQKNLSDKAIEIIVVDQRANHEGAVLDYLNEKVDSEDITYYDLNEASLTKARNHGVCVANGDVILFCDDDILPGENLLENHLTTYDEFDAEAVAGQVLNEGQGPTFDPGSFSHNEVIHNFDKLYGANFSIKREMYEKVEGSDENLGVHSYSEDIILAKRIHDANGTIIYNPAASVVHLIHEKGGCRIGDSSQETEEWEKSFSMIYYAICYASGLRSKMHYLFRAIRHGPLRRENVLEPWRQPAAWLGLAKALAKATKQAFN